MADIKKILLRTLEQLQKAELQRFQWYLINDDDNAHSCIPRSQMENIDQTGTVDKMLQYYCQNGAVEISLKILKQMQQNQLAENLRQEISLRNSSTDLNKRSSLDLNIGRLELRLEIERHSKEISDLRVQNANLMKEIEDLRLKVESKLRKNELPRHLRLLQKKLATKEHTEIKQHQELGSTNDQDLRLGFGITPDSSCSETLIQTEKEGHKLEINRAWSEDRVNPGRVSKLTAVYEGRITNQCSTHLHLQQTKGTEVNADNSQDIRRQSEGMSMLDSSEHKNFAPISLKAQSTGVPEVPEVFDREYVVEKIKENIDVHTDKNEATPQSIEVFNLLPEKQDVVNTCELLRDERADLTFRVTKTPKEAIAVLFNLSSLMSEECFDAECQMTRIDAIKQMFDSLSNRCMAYDFDHVMCLVKFDSEAKTVHTFTENLETFKEYVHSLQESGTTGLFDALNCGSEELAKVKAKFPDCRCRILCLTDGNDVGSTCRAVEVAKKLMISNIVVDAVIVGTVENTVLHGISNVTGGCCFKPETIKAAMKLFEMETVLSMELRKEKKKFDVSSINNEEDLKKIFLAHQYDEKPETNTPPQINNKVTIIQNVLKKITESRKITESKSGRFMQKDKRILEELKSLHCDPHPYCTVLPSESDVSFWKILMQGPPETPYENGVFELYCEFGPDYPVKPPLMRFFTPIYHCNINSVGRICHNIFDRNYSAHITMREILDAVYGLLIAPEPEDPLDSILAEEYMTNKAKYEEEAQKNTRDNANSSMDEVEKKYAPEMMEMIIPPNLACPLTKKLYVDPVRTKEGFMYERKAIEKHLKRFPSDPQTKKSLRTRDLKEDKDMKRMVKNFRRTQIQETSV